MSEMTCINLLKLMTKSRFLISEFGENFRIHEKNNDDFIRS
jgi:hypothetical protein